MATLKKLAGLPKHTKVRELIIALNKIHPLFRLHMVIRFLFLAYLLAKLEEVQDIGWRSMERWDSPVVSLYWPWTFSLLCSRNFVSIGVGSWLRCLRRSVPLPALFWVFFRRSQSWMHSWSLWKPSAKTVASVWPAEYPLSWGSAYQVMSSLSPWDESYLGLY